MWAQPTRETLWEGDHFRSGGSGEKQPSHARDMQYSGTWLPSGVGYSADKKPLMTNTSHEPEERMPQERVRIILNSWDRISR